ncbi:MAG: DNA polymerase III subunit delta' [Desulfobacterales bacterium]
MPRFDSIVDQDRPVQILTTFLEKGTIPHALLFTGIEGVGKQTAAMAFAMACNCKGKDPGRFEQENGGSSDKQLDRFAHEPCGQCGPCRKIESGNHPDIIHIKPSGDYIRIAQIRTLIETLALKPYEARRRVVIISGAQAMNPAAGNALLKMLEEPPDRTFLILIAEQRADLLPTIVSRCQHIRFNPISRESLAALLTGGNGATDDEALLIAGMANGSLTRAQTMHRTDWIPWRNWLIEASGLDQPATLSARPVGLLLAFAEKLSGNKESIFEALEIMKSWLRDLIVAHYGPDRVINADVKEKIQQTSRKSSIKSLMKMTEVIQKAQMDLGARANARLTLEVMMMRLARE